MSTFRSMHRSAQEVRRRDDRSVGGAWCDSVVCSILEDDWRLKGRVHERCAWSPWWSDHHDVEAIPRNTTIARLSRTRSASWRAPICAPSLERDTVVILSTMSRQDSCRPLSGVASMFKRSSGASVGSVVKGQTMTESVSKRSSWMITAGRGFPA